MSALDDFDRATGGAAQPQSAIDQFDAALANQNVQASAPRPRIQVPQDLSMMDKLLAKVPTGLVNNPAVAGARNVVTTAAYPLVGGTQFIANAMPDSTGVPQTYNQKVAEMLRKDADAAKESGPIASAVNHFVGGLISPTNLAMAGSLAPATSMGARAIQGATVGGIAGATDPVNVGESGKFWGQKAGQIAIGAGSGALLQPVIGAVADKVASKIAAKGYNPANAAADADEIIAKGLSDSGQTVKDLPPDQLASLRAEVAKSLQSGKQLDAAAALRAQDFRAEGIQPTLGMVTRDPRQWEAEQNVRGVKGAGEEVGKVLASGNRAVTQKVGQFGNSADEAATASQKLADALRSYDSTQAGNVSTAYATGRASAGKDLELPGMNLANTYMEVKQDFEGKIPPAVQRKIESFADNPLTFEEADKLRKIINAHVGENPTTDKALGILRSALNNAQTQGAANGGPFAPAVKLASERFAQHEEIPALAKAANGPVDDRFVQQSIISNPSTPQVQKLAALLKEQSPETFQQARQQIGQHLAQAAFGENAAGDKLVRQESYNKALRQLGTGKLNAFFEPSEVEQMKRLGRISSYQVSPPATAASNYSNTASALANLLRSAGGFLPVAKGPVQFAGDKITASAALRPEVPVTPNLTPQQRLALSRALTGITGGASAGLGGIVGQ